MECSIEEHMKPTLSSKDLAAIAVIRVASQGKPGAFCPACNVLFASRWSPKLISEHVATCVALATKDSK